MKTQKRKWMIAGIAAVFLLLALLWAEWILDMQRPMSIRGVAARGTESRRDPAAGPCHERHQRGTGVSAASWVRPGQTDGHQRRKDRWKEKAYGVLRPDIGIG